MDFILPFSLFSQPPIYLVVLLCCTTLNLTSRSRALDKITWYYSPDGLRKAVVTFEGRLFKSPREFHPKLGSGGNKTVVTFTYFITYGFSYPPDG